MTETVTNVVAFICFWRGRWEIPGGVVATGDLAAGGSSPPCGEMVVCGHTDSGWWLQQKVWNSGL